MKFLFEPNPSHQREAEDAIVSVFDGAPYTRPEERDGGISPSDFERKMI